MLVPVSARLKGGWSLVAHSLSGRLLLLTLLYLLSSEVLIFLPAIGLYHRELLDDHILSAELAILPFTEPGGQGLSESLQTELLKHANASAVMLKRSNRRDLYQAAGLPQWIDRTIDLTSDSLGSDIVNGLDCLVNGGARTLHVIAPTHIKGAQSIGIVLGEVSIKNALVVYARRVVAAALFISGVTAGLVYASLFFFLVRPMRRITHAMVSFHENPEDASRIFSASRRADEIGIAERELAAMQRDLYGFLRQKARLAALGAAVARIQHDLRNILANAQLASDRLAASEDPVVKRLAPSLVASIGRAIALATSTLKYGRAEEPAPQRTAVPLRRLVEEVSQSVLGEDACIAFDNAVTPDVMIDADRDQLFRVVLNLIRNAADALALRGEPGQITVSAVCDNRRVEIDIADNGPGLPESIIDRLFQPFASAARVGGTGLGLAIARDLARAHGGDLNLVSTGKDGTVFRIIVPQTGDRSDGLGSKHLSVI